MRIKRSRILKDRELKDREFLKSFDLLSFLIIILSFMTKNDKKWQKMIKNNIVQVKF